MGYLNNLKWDVDSDTSILVDFDRIADLTLVVKISDMLRREVFGSVDSDGKTDLEQKTKNLERGSSGAAVSSVASINQIQDPLLLSRSRAPPRGKFVHFLVRFSTF